MRVSIALALAAATVLTASCKNKGPAPTPLTAAEKASLVAAMAPPYNEADLANGAKMFGMCKSCHTLAWGGANMTGPNLYGIFGRQAGTYPEFRYSDAVKNAGFKWDESHIDQWLIAPKAFLHGTKMTFPGLDTPLDRRDLIAYLKVETTGKPAPAK